MINVNMIAGPSQVSTKCESLNQFGFFGHETELTL